MKKIVCLLLSLCLCVGLCVPALALSHTGDEVYDYISWVRNGSVDEFDSPFDSNVINLGKLWHGRRNGKRN